MADAVPPDAGPPAASPPAASPPAPHRWPSSRLVPLLIVTLAGVLIVGIVLAGRSQQDAGLAALGSATADAATLPVTLPLRQVAGHLVVDVALGDGDATVPMLLDSGSPTVLADALAARYAGERAGTVSSVSPVGEVSSSPVTQIRSLRLGTAAFHAVGAVAGWVAAEDPLACLSPAGLIGASLMQHAVWQVDPLAGTLTVAAGTDGLAHVDGALRLPFERASVASPSPILHLPLGDGSVDVLLDTGSDGWLTVHPADLEGAGVPVPEDAPAMDVLLGTAAGDRLVRVTWATADVRLGDARPAAMPIAISEAVPQGQGSMGNAFLDDFVLTIDWTQDVVYLDPIAASADGSLHPRPSALPSASVSWRDGYVLGSLAEGASHAARVVPGAALSAIDGQAVGSATFDDFCARAAAGDAGAGRLTVATDPPVELVIVPMEIPAATAAP